MTKVAIIYYSGYGSVHAMAQHAAKAAEAAGAEVRLRHVVETAPQQAIDSQEAWKAHVEEMKDQPTASPDDIDWADVVLFGSGTRYGHVTSQLQAYIDTLGPLWGAGKLADKVYAGFTASSTLHGGQESTLLGLYTSIYHFGGIVVAPGYTDPVKFKDGNPYGVGKVTGANPELDDDDRASLDHMVTRCVRFADKLTA